MGEIAEIDVAPVQIQGPKAPLLMDDCIPEGSTCGTKMSQMKYYDCLPVKINGCDAMVTASGFSTELGYEIYLRDATINAEKMWNYVLEKGVKHHLKVIAPGHHRRIEAGLMSHGQDIDIEVNPYECGMGWQVDLKRSDNFVGRKALEKVKAEGGTHKLAGCVWGVSPLSGTTLISIMCLLPITRLSSVTLPPLGTHLRRVVTSPWLCCLSSTLNLGQNLVLPCQTDTRTLMSMLLR